MEDETENFASEAENDNVMSSEDDNAPEWDYFDPEEEPETEENPDEGVTEDEEAATEEEPEAVEAEESEEDPQDAYAEEDHKVKLADGEEITVGELIKGRLMQADYSRKTQELSNQRKAVEADASKIEGITQAFVDHMASLLPQEPDQSLIYSDPVKYSQQKAIYDNSLAQIQKLIEIGSQPKEVQQGMQERDQQTVMHETQTALAQKFPQISTREGFGQFMGEVSQGAQSVGFTNDDLQQAFSLPNGDKLIELAYWANKGKAAEKAKKAVKAKAQKAPPAKPVKPGQAGRQANRNREAMQKLSRSGSISDALKVDWD